MPLYQTGGYRVKAAAVEKVKRAIEELVRYVTDHEPGTEMYLAWQKGRSDAVLAPLPIQG